MMTYPKRLIEVDLPIKRISAHARREKSIRHGHICTLHIWWARRPLAACRAVLCAALWPDPADEHCPQAFRDAASTALCDFAEQVRTTPKLAELCQAGWSRWNRTTRASLRANDWACWPDMRYALLDFIADFANWDASAEPHFLATARALTQAAHESLGGLPGTRPLVVDPFAGGGAIPLEALRVGADAFASDLNPVAVLLNKVVLEYIPRYGQRLADEVRKWGDWIKEQAEQELAEFYPKDRDGAMPIAYLWARTIRCEGPGCGAEVPLMRSLWLARKKNRSVALRAIPNPRKKRVDFEIIEDAKPEDVSEGTVRRGSATCPVCGYTTPVTSVRRQLSQRRGGAADARLFAVVTTRAGQKGRFYRLPTERDLEAVRKAAAELERRKQEHKGPLDLVPDEPTPDNTGHRAVGSLWIYGMREWGDLFTPRQALTLTTLVRLISEAGKQLEKGLSNELAEATQTVLGLALSRFADICNSLCMWESTKTQVRHLFTRQALPMLWDFAEPNAFAGAAGDYSVTLGTMIRVLDRALATDSSGSASLVNAIVHPLPDDAAQCFFTDPPYYDAVPYADLADFFYVWLRRTVAENHGDLFQEALTPKQKQAIVWHPGSDEERLEFERKMAQAMTEGRRVLSPPSVGIVVFAHKSTAGWEAQLQAMIEAGWTITASWPVDTELGNRMNAQGTASLASSIHLICRPRENPDGSLRTDAVGEWRDVLGELPRRIHAWMPRLAQEGVVGADAIFACLGPALEIYSRYSRVERADGTAVPLGDVLDDRGRVVERGYLSYVWEAVSKEALSMIFEGADTAGFEADARLTAMWLWTLSTATNGVEAPANGKAVKSVGYTLEYDAARKIAQGLGAHLERLSNLVEIKGGKARLLPVAERTRALFGKEGPSAPRGRRKSAAQLSLFAEMDATEAERELGDLGAPPAGATVLDRVHQAMLLFATGRSEALRRFLVEEGIGQEARFWRLAQALSALYPPHTDEKRWVDGVLGRKKGLGL